MGNYPAHPSSVPEGNVEIEQIFWYSDPTGHQKRSQARRQLPPRSDMDSTTSRAELQSILG